MCNRGDCSITEMFEIPNSVLAPVSADCVVPQVVAELEQRTASNTGELGELTMPIATKSFGDIPSD